VKEDLNTSAFKRRLNVVTRLWLIVRHC